MAKTKKHAAKKALLKKIIKGKKNGASPIAMDNGLGKNPITSIGSGGGSNLGTNGIF